MDVRIPLAVSEADTEWPGLSDRLIFKDEYFFFKFLVLTGS
ncbi:hypothetical protein CYPRO_3281 [Cyclonatronum proteinivorum]|uniref:Uncharacterized protein n=1 Tax=Cyclonatronum proteinivorum TaxID=1457365 RepID=A0A345UPW2_9BACT|nr:hypothetical protein CYPRO_3281 [Cyclonatronum proteinivorum]